MGQNETSNTAAVSTNGTPPTSHTCQALTTVSAGALPTVWVCRKKNCTTQHLMQHLFCDLGGLSQECFCRCCSWVRQVCALTAPVSWKGAP